ncbi:hypothetical protein POM88_035400 [Heracleum sosnowskyi]|uniref:Uncharacterized protein n=1 Tax=Heracleum sosnowskyi TaxID=360622 RepID=A0AAD8HMB3_9APIA|nr:hypothetical protein POM88_035400 [Heracleum sosnowskyi]
MQNGFEGKTLMFVLNMIALDFKPALIQMEERTRLLVKVRKNHCWKSWLLINAKRRFLSNGKPTRTGGISSGTSGSVRQGSEKKKDLQTILKQGFKLCHFTLSMLVRHVEEQLLKAVE